MATRWHHWVTLLFVLLFITPWSVFSEIENPNEAQKTEKTLPSLVGTARLKAMVDLSIWYSEKDLNQSMVFGQQGVELARKLGDKRMEGKCLQLLGNVMNEKEKPDEALRLFQEGADIYSRLGDHAEVARSYLYIGSILSTMGRLDEAISRLRQALDHYQKTGSLRGISTANHTLASIFTDRGDYENALKCELLSLKAAEQSGNTQFVANDLNGLGSIYEGLKQFDKSMESYQSALRAFKELKDRFGEASTLGNIGQLYWDTNKPVEARKYYLQALEIARKIENLYLIGTMLNNLAVDSMNQKQYDQAAAYLTETLKIQETTRRVFDQSVTHLNIGEVRFLQRRFKDAETAYLKALEISRQIGAVENQSEIYEKLAKLCYETKRYKESVDYYREFLKFNEKVINATTQKKVVEMQARYEAEKRSKQIEILTRDNDILKKNGEIQKLQLSRARLQTQVFIFGALLVVIVFGFFIRKYRHLVIFWRKKNFVGHYRILDKIGSGAMGVVYRARHVRERSGSVALKVIREEMGQDETLRRRFIHEALIVDQLNHPNIVKVFERGEHQKTLFFAMELLEGTTLSNIIRERSPLELEMVVSISRQLMDAVSKVHSKGIVHRDLKPDNIMLVSRDGNSHFVKVTDFGLAHAKALSSITESGVIVGTVNYMPPEQITQQEFGPAGDVYAIGVIMYEMAVGKKPFEGEVYLDIIRQVLDTVPIPPANYRPDMPEMLNTLILSMMSKIADERPSEAHVLEVLESLNEVIQSDNPLAPNTDTQAAIGARR